MDSLTPVILAQYANSPTILAMLNSMNVSIDPSADIDAFFDVVWNVDTAVGFGLDMWGERVGLPNGRYLQIPVDEIKFGFDEAGTASAAPLGQGTFYGGPVVTSTYALLDEAFRSLILVKALANISDCSIPNLNTLLQTLFAGRGRCYVNDLGNMMMRFTFEFYLTPVEQAILTQADVLPRPSGVQYYVVTIPTPDVFGFAEAGTASVAPFGQGSFFNGDLNAV